MNRLRHFLRLAPCAAALLLACATQVRAPQALRFSVPDGRALNEFYRQGPVAAHIVLTSGSAPRVVFAFPAGNSGAAVWFDAESNEFAWSPDVTISPARRNLEDGSVLRGVTAAIVATGGSVTVREALLSSVRVIRDREDADRITPEVISHPRISQQEVAWQRRRLDGAAGYALSIEVQRGTLVRNEAGSIVLSPTADGRLHLRLTALTGDTPLTPLPEDALLTSSAAPDERLVDILTFLTYAEKLLAGSWRFNTYFGRDTLMSLRLLAPALRAPVIEAGLTSVLERLNADGEVAHEEDIGEFAVLRHLEAGRRANDTPIYDYKMIDDDFMLPVIAAHYLLDSSDGRPRAATFLARRTESGETFGARLLRNFRFILNVAAPFAGEPGWPQLIALKPGVNVGNWRDSEVGLGGGRYPYDVNGVLAPAALEAIRRLHESALLNPYLGRDDEPRLANAAAMAVVWRREAPQHFDVSVPSSVARAEVEAYARAVGVDAAPALEALGDEGVRFRAVSLDAQGRPIPIVNSDEAFALLFLEPDAAEVERIAETLTRPFPVGLLTEVGLLVANPAYAAGSLEPLFDRNRYHGTVIWSWQQALFAAGLDRQLARADLTSSARTALEHARSRVLAAIAAAENLRGSELWSWSQMNGRYRIEPFGQRQEDETESNAAQLWSTVQLARPRE